MGKKGSWFCALNRALSYESKEKKDKKNNKSKRWSRKQKSLDLDSSNAEENAPVVPALDGPVEELKLIKTEDEQNRHAYSVAFATAAAAEAAVAAAQAAEVVRLTTAAHNLGRTKEEIAAIKIQTAFRGYLARRALKALKGLVRLKSLIRGNSVKRQATTTLRCMQTLARVQSEIRARRIRMTEENMTLQRQLQQKHEKELEKLRASTGEDWNDSMQSKEQIEANLQHRQEAAMRRERALAYAYSHQQTWKSSKSSNQTFMDPNNPHWGWSWLERWMASRPWENGSAMDKELDSDHASMKSTTSRPASVGGITRTQSHRVDNKLSPTAHKRSRPPSRQSPLTPTSKVSGRLTRGNTAREDDSRSLNSVKSEVCRRHSIAGSSVRDNESLASSPSVPGYMAGTKSVKAKSRLSSPLRLEKNGTPEKFSPVSAKKRLSFSPSGPRRHSGPPR
ncbi:protein IQ-DOMAIN 1-like [Olea europaea var. sylvestris]|uniref:protein IQ-DOMAIN 1-like n=1 Tax=Olea europaea var. sylvestris TaxID=158386 RepID=UPI000C1D1997|nr:protein IQ-DOMAIN 1-like [Olea europaea var. sylvestris]XP_022870108.1 protein IQ-DOMAIN 1-like [Olea europaea var. sylvestris]XP_022870109.1 protein IQ-DOMAIN 1-like [Olea europaea var. sylvestris]